MAGIAAKVLDRFKPGIFDRLKQSAEAKKQAKEKRLTVVPPEPRKTETARYDREPMLLQQTTSLGTRGTAYTQQIWQTWNTYGTTGATCDPWGTWHRDHQTIRFIDTATTMNVWGNWNHNSTNAVTTNAWLTWQDQPQPYRRPVETPEQRRVREQQEVQYRAEREAANARYYEEQRAAENRRKEADERAITLLVSVLNDQQRADFKREKHFFVDAPSGRLYRIDYGMHGNVKVIDRKTRKVTERLCIQPRDVPAGDANLMQKLLIETAEETFRAHANITLEDGSVVYGKREDLTGDRLAQVIPLRRAA